MKNKICPCGSSLSFEECCKPIIDRTTEAQTAEQLMRSRYTAFTLADAGYLLKSWAEEARQYEDKDDLRRWAKSVQWVKLNVIETENGMADDDKGYVTFQAFYRDKGKLRKIEERSYFEKRNGKWYYVSGVHK